MDNEDSPIARVERTLWTVWNYITGAVNRFLRPDPADISNNDPNSINEPEVDGESAHIGHTDIESGVDEEQSLPSASLLSSSRPLVAWDHCTTNIDLKPDEESVRYKTQSSRGSESNDSEEGQGTREEPLEQKGNDNARLQGTKEDGQEKDEDQKLHTHGQDEKPENREDEDDAITRSLRHTGDAMSEDMAHNEIKTGDDQNKKAMTPEDRRKMHETIQEQEEEEHGDEDVQVEDGEVNLITDFSLDKMDVEEAKLQRNEADREATPEEVENKNGASQLASENENKFNERAKQVCEEFSDDDKDFKEDPGFFSLHVEPQRNQNKDGILPEEELNVVEQEHAMADRRESDKAEEEEEEEVEEGEEVLEVEVEEEEVEEEVLEVLEEQKSTLDEGDVKEESVSEATNNQTIEEASEEADILAECVTCSEEDEQNDKTEPQAAEFTYGEQEDEAKDTETKTKETESHVVDENSDVTTTHFSVEFDKGQEEEERLSSEVVHEESYMEIACTTTSVTVRPEGETGEEMSGECKDIPLRICEGQLVVSQELSSQTREETQEGVPDFNNKPDENTTQRFLEEGDCEEILGSQLPEEVEGKESESLQNSGSSTGADYLLERERREEGEESTRDIENSFDDRPTEDTEKQLLEAAIQESGHFFEEEEKELLLVSMKSRIVHSEKELESHISLTDEKTEETQDGTEDLLVEFDLEKGSFDYKLSDQVGSEAREAVPAEEVVWSTDETVLESEIETSFFQESVDARNSKQNKNMTPSFLDNVTDFEFLKQPEDIGHKILVEMHDAGIDVEEMGYGIEQEAEEDVMQNNSELEILHQKVEGIAESELEVRNQLSDEALQITKEEMLTQEAGDSKTAESKPKDMSVLSTEDMAEHVRESEGSYDEETVCSTSGRQDVIDEEILDLWIQTALSKDTEGIKQQDEPEARRQIELSNEEQDEISSVQTEKDKGQLVASNLKESELVSDTETSSSTVESGFSDQSLSEGGETQLLKSTSAGSFQGIYDMLVNLSESADFDELSTQQLDSQDILMEETAETGRSYLKEEKSITETGFQPDAGVPSPDAGHPYQESDKAREKSDDDRAISGEADTVSQTDIEAEVTDWKDTKEADPLFKEEKPESEDEPLQRSVSPDEIKHIEPGRSRSGSEASSSGEDIVMTESGSQGDTEPPLRWSEVEAESLPEPNEVEVGKMLMAEYEDLLEVDSAALDFTVQRARISVKDPRVRPPKDPRSLLQMPSVDPTPSPRLPAKFPAGVPLGGMGMGIKLPGFGAGFPVLKKTQRVERDENSPDTVSQEQEEKSDTPKQDEAQQKPKWMPPRHPGFGNPLMSELKTKLKKTTKE
ncbi:nestin isoform X2 [Notothenia coriiceps]|uniref:Nestin isoform X2 n=1 Tax=Notothenia coriiceps TaxID=8208 RepID=A0A6I9NQ10_9TELE|nr:PREDICTED: nestin-like isoform X2 [Notothenia coriiceps]